MNNLSQFQFLRVEAYRCTNTDNLLMEANRVATHSSHILEPRAPRWDYGSPQAVQQAVDSLMTTPQTVRHKNGKPYTRTPRSDFRGILGCITSYPLSIAELLQATRQEGMEFVHWSHDTQCFMEEEFGAQYLAAVVHLDEAYPHLHHFVVGPAVRLHPGLRAELDENDRRLADAKERMRRYKQALSDMLDRFHAQVSVKYGHGRNGQIRPAPRVKDRRTYLEAMEAARSTQVDVPGGGLSPSPQKGA